MDGWVSLFPPQRVVTDALRFPHVMEKNGMVDPHPLIRGGSCGVIRHLIRQTTPSSHPNACSQLQLSRLPIVERVKSPVSNAGVFNGENCFPGLKDLWDCVT